MTSSLQWCCNECDGVGNHQPHDCLLNTLFRRRLMKISSKLRVTGLCVGKSPVTVEFPTQMANNAENVSIWWRHHDNGRDGVSNHQSYDCLLNCLFKRRSNTSKLRVSGLCAGNSPVTGEFPTEIASNVENVTVWWRHYTILFHFVALFPINVIFLYETLSIQWLFRQQQGYWWLSSLAPGHQ